MLLLAGRAGEMVSDAKYGQRCGLRHKPGTNTPPGPIRPTQIATHVPSLDKDKFLMYSVLFCRQSRGFLWTSVYNVTYIAQRPSPAPSLDSNLPTRGVEHWLFAEDDCR